MDTQSKVHFFLALQKLKGFGLKAQSMVYQYTKELQVDWSDLDSRMPCISASLQRNRRLKSPTLRELRHAFSEVTAQLPVYVEHNITIIPRWDPRYPNRLQQLEDAPVLLFAKGNLDALNAAKSIAIVGTREPTDVGMKVAYQFGKTAAEQGAIVVSGLALGCDTAAHQGCLSVGGATIAVLAHGLDEPVYPKQNRSLATQILDQEGLLLSEYPLKTSISRFSLVQRDKWQAALSDAVWVVETGITGGTMHTVDFARTLNRPVSCFLGDVDWCSKVQAQGNLRLIGEGAMPLLGSGVGGMEAW